MMRIVHIERREPLAKPAHKRPAKPVPSAKRRKRSGRVQGLGDLIERIAKPIARWLDRMTRTFPQRYRTQLGGCSACSRRRRWLNLIVPDVRQRELWSTAWRRILPAWQTVFRRPARPVQAAGKRTA